MKKFKIDLPYYIEHGLISLFITGLVYLIPGLGLVAAGFFFYLGREIRDLEKLHDWDMKGFDWPGFLWPLGIMVVLYLMYILF